jgi:hypothetical protein
MQKMDLSYLKNERLSETQTKKFVASSEWINVIQEYHQEMRKKIDIQIIQYKKLEEIISEMKKSGIS